MPRKRRRPASRQSDRPGDSAMKRSPVFGDLVLTPAERKGMESYYRAIQRRDHAARRGTYREWQAAEARVRELEPTPAVPKVHTAVHGHDKPLPCSTEWTAFLGRRK